MSQTLGEKLRQAREERGISIADVAEQTRISPYYLESIERDDYKPLPGGIFNRGFVKSYAKYVEMDEQEALEDYSRLLAANDTSDEPSLKVYRPEVLTDDRSGNSMIPTVIMAVVILSLMSAGLYFFSTNYEQLLGYFQSRPAAENKNSAANSNSGSSSNTNSGSSTSVPEMSTLRVEFKALGAPVSLASTIDGKSAEKIVGAGSTETFEPKESLKLGYSRSLANVVQLTINGKSITLPSQPLVQKRKSIEFEINKSNLGQIWQNGAISTDVPAAVADANTVGGPTTTAPRQTPAVKPNPTPQTATTPSAKPAETPKPAPPKPAGNRPQ